MCLHHHLSFPSMCTWSFVSTNHLSQFKNRGAIKLTSIKLFYINYLSISLFAELEAAKKKEYLNDGIITDGVGYWHAVCCSVHLLLWRLIMETVSLLLLFSCMLTRLSYCVLAPLSWQQNHVMCSEVMATVQIRVVAEEKKGADPFFFFWPLDLYSVKHLSLHAENERWKDDTWLVIEYNGDYYCSSSVQMQGWYQQALSFNPMKEHTWLAEWCSCAVATVSIEQYSKW